MPIFIGRGAPTPPGSVPDTWVTFYTEDTGNTFDDHRSFSASLRNSSGTEGEMPSATDPYPMASHPKRSRILSTAWSAAQRAMPFLVPGRRASSASSSGSSSSRSQCFPRCDTEIAGSEIVFSSGCSPLSHRRTVSRLSPPRLARSRPSSRQSHVASSVFWPHGPFRKCQDFHRVFQPTPQASEFPRQLPNIHPLPGISG